MSQTNLAVPATGRKSPVLYVAIVYMVVAAYWSLAPAGPGVWAAKLQASVLGGHYSPKVSVMLLMLPPILVYSLFAKRDRAAA